MKGEIRKGQGMVGNKDTVEEEETCEREDMLRENRNREEEGIEQGRRGRVRRKGGGRYEGGTRGGRE